jgi:phosphoribosylformylglycinamidine synthase
MTSATAEHDVSALLLPQDAAAGAAHGLKAEEYDVILNRLGRAPNLVELGVFSVMWSEHCSYKSTRRHLGKFPTTGERVIQGPGENAGVIDIGDGQACIFKMESHNHPSYIEPYQGAATGVGGILRDVFTMGARPVALVNALRFGDPSHPKTRSLLAGVVGGIGGYGNCVGVPTVAGETQFHRGYNGNILVNAMAVGLADQDRIFYSRGAEPGLSIFYVGSKTGRDGIHGATMASAEFSEGDEEKRPTVQVGDPFTEKLLIEACLELMSTDAIQCIQDMGAAGLTSSSVEIADKGGVGVEMDLDRVPQRESGMTAYEIMLSESQERMLMVLKPGRESIAKAIFEKWDLDAEVIGRTTDTGRLVLIQHGRTVCDIPVAPLSNDAPSYNRPYVDPPSASPLPELAEPQDFRSVLLRLIACPDMCSKRWVWEQYDRHVMADTIASSQDGGDAAIVRVHGSSKALAICSDCNPHYVASGPFEGGKQAVAESYRNLCAVGATPIAITDNLNFGNPEKPETMGVIVRAIEGMADACRGLDFPVVSGNVSLYNETDGVGIPPTPVVGGVGLIDDLGRRGANWGSTGDCDLYLIGDMGTHLGASLYVRETMGLSGREAGPPPPVDIAAEKRNGTFVRTMISEGRARAAKDLSDGGLLLGLAEFALQWRCGLDVRLDDGEASLSSLLGEDQARYLLCIGRDDADHAGAMAHRMGVPFRKIGSTSARDLSVSEAGRLIVMATSDELFDAHEAWLPSFMKG